MILFASYSCLLVQCLLWLHQSMHSCEHVGSFHLYFEWLLRVFSHFTLKSVLSLRGTHMVLFWLEWLKCSGTEGGDIVILNSSSMKTQTVVKKAHIGFVTALAFSHDSRFWLRYYPHLCSKGFLCSPALTLIDCTAGQLFQHPWTQVLQWLRFRVVCDFYDIQTYTNMALRAKAALNKDPTRSKRLVIVANECCVRCEYGKAR